MCRTLLHSINLGGGAGLLGEEIRIITISVIQRRSQHSRRKIQETNN